MSPSSVVFVFIFLLFSPFYQSATLHDFKYEVVVQYVPESGCMCHPSNDPAFVVYQITQQRARKTSTNFCGDLEFCDLYEHEQYTDDCRLTWTEDDEQAWHVYWFDHVKQYCGHTENIPAWDVPEDEYCYAKNNWCESEESIAHGHYTV
jgi:hypothetical protein